MPVKPTPWEPVEIQQTQPPQVHLSEGEDQWYGDSRKAPEEAGPDGKTDTNLQELLDGVGCIHKGKPAGTGWRYLQIAPGVRRKLTEKELQTPYSQWPRKKFKRLSRTRFPGKSFESRVHPLLYVESLVEHAKHGAIMCGDLKSPFTRKRATAMVAEARARKVTVWFKTLAHQGLKDPDPHYSMAVAGAKLRTFHEAGGQTALACHGYPVPADVHKWEQWIDAFWGVNSHAFRRAVGR